MYNNKIRFSEFIMFFYVFSITFFPIGSFPLKIIKVIFCFLTIFLIIRRNKVFLLTNKYVFFILLFNAFCFLSTCWAESPKYAMSMSITLLLNSVCLLFLMYLIIDNKNSRSISVFDSFLPVLYGIVFGSIFMGLRVYLLNGPLIFIKTSLRAVDGISANTLGMNCAIAAIIIIMLTKNGKSHFFKALFIITVLFTVLSASRKSLIFLGGPILFTMIFKNKNWIKIFISFIFVCIIVLISYVSIMKVPFLYNAVGHRVESMIEAFRGTGGDASARTRSLMISRGITWFKEKPIKGYGINNYSYLFGINIDSVWGEKGVYAHNNYVELLVDVGVIGTIIYYLLHLNLILLWIKKFKKRNYNTTMFMGILFSIIVTDYGMVSYFNILTQIVILLGWFIMNEEKIVMRREL